MGIIRKALSIVVGIFAALYSLGAIGTLLTGEAISVFLIGLITSTLFAFVSYKIWPKSQSYKNTEKAILNDTQLKNLFKLGSKILDDHNISKEEAQQLKSWFERCPTAYADPRTSDLSMTVFTALEDDVLDKNEKYHVFMLLSDFCDEYTASREDDQTFFSDFDAELIPAENSSLEVGKEYKLKYEDSNGNYTNRHIVFKEYVQNKEYDYIKAICKKRGAMRTFRVDRMIELHSVETGEVLI